MIIIKSLLLALICFYGCEAAKSKFNNLKPFCEKLNDPRRKWIPGSDSKPFGTCDVKTFLDYCQNPDTSDDMLITVNAIKDHYQNRSCLSVWEAIKESEEINLDNQGIKDITPLGGLTRLKKISLKNNEIEDIWILAAMEHLEELSLEGNPIHHLRPEERNCTLYLEHYPYETTKWPTQVYKSYCGFE